MTNGEVYHEPIAESWKEELPRFGEEIAAALRAEEERKFEEEFAADSRAVRRGIIVASMLTVLAMIEQTAASPTLDWQVLAAKKLNDMFHSGFGGVSDEISFRASAVLNWLILAADAVRIDIKSGGTLAHALRSLTEKITYHA